MFDPTRLVGIKISRQIYGFLLRDFPKKEKTHCLDWCRVMTPEKGFGVFCPIGFFRGLCQVGWCTTNLKFENLTFDLVAIFSNWAYPFLLGNPFFRFGSLIWWPHQFQVANPKRGEKKQGKQLSGSELLVGRMEPLPSSTCYAISTGDLDINSTSLYFRYLGYIGFVLSYSIGHRVVEIQDFRDMKHLPHFVNVFPYWKQMISIAF